MKIKFEKICFLITILIVGIIFISGCKSSSIKLKEENKNISEIEINEENAKAINIMNIEITNILSSQSNDISTKIENSSNFHISNIWITYEELDKNKNVISKSKSVLDLTLNPRESSSILFSNNEYTDTINVVAYGYEAEGEIVYINLKNGDIQIKESPKQIENSKEYEILALSEIYINEDNKQMIKVKNISQRDLGNISLKIGELKDNEYKAVNYLPAYNILKSLEEIEVEIIPLTDSDKLYIVGYSYDDIEEKENIDIDLKSHKAIVNK